MADGRDIIEEVLEALSQVKSRIPEQSNAYSADEAAELKDILESASKWIQQCRKKIWLRGKEGTDMAQGCLDGLAAPEVAMEAASDLAYRLESLARLLSTKSQVLT
jgi:hypothetical protein